MTIKKSVKSNVTFDSTAKENSKTAAKKRAERNKARTTKYVGKLLSLFATGVARGYEDQDWRYMSQLYAQLSPFLMLEEMNALGKLWRTSWVEEPSHMLIMDIIGIISDRIGTQCSIDPELSQRVVLASNPETAVVETDKFQGDIADVALPEYVVDEESDDAANFKKSRMRGDGYDC
jgi:hypothetical protein